MTNQPMVGDGLFRWIENPVYRLLGISPQQQMNWKQYSLAFVVSCVFLAVTVLLFYDTSMATIKSKSCTKYELGFSITVISF